MNKNVTKVYLTCLNEVEKFHMTNTLKFLRSKDNASKEMLVRMANNLYSESNRLELESYNGHTPTECCSRYNSSMHFLTIIQFKQEDLTEEAIKHLGKCDEWDWRYFYSISVCMENRKLYLVSFANACSPNWNNKYNTKHFIELDSIDFNILKEDEEIYRMDDALHTAINNELYSDYETFYVDDGEVRMTIKDQHGNYYEIYGNSTDEVFRDYADNYTGYRNYRRQTASEWVIVSNVAQEAYNEWRKTATNLKSDFDKFYGGGIVD